MELIHAVQSEKYDLVAAGTHGTSGWEHLWVGGTAKRLIRKCPCSALIVKAEHAEPPRVVLAGTDFSEVSLKAAREATCIAQHANAEFHLLHVIDTMGIPEEVLVATERTSRLRQEISDEAICRIDDFLERSACNVERTQIHLAWGTPWKEIQILAERIQADLVAMGTVGRGGIQGLLLGNTAENVLSTSGASVLTVKPDGFASPIEPAEWELHPVTPS